MALSHVLEAYDRLSSPRVTGDAVAALWQARGLVDVQVETVSDGAVSTDFVSGLVRSPRADAPVLGLIGRLGGLGARPAVAGLVSDADGAIAAVAAGLLLADMARDGEALDAGVRIHTHIAPRASTRPHHPVPMMRSPLPMRAMMAREVHPSMEAILSIDTSRGNRLVNERGVAITPTAKEGWVLRTSEDLLDILGWVSGRLPLVLPITTQDITPYEAGLWHVNSIMQPATATAAPVVGVALTAQATVPGCAPGASQVDDIATAVRFCAAVAAAFGQGRCRFHDPDEWELIQRRYGSLAHLQTLGRDDPA
jgi:hypothetical protein